MAKFLGIDIKDFYLMTKMDNPEFMYLPRWIFPQECIDEYGIEYKFYNNKILVRINKGMYGLPQTGRLAYIELIKFLSKHGYVHAGLAAGLFKHVTRPMTFTLFVDDFGVKYNSREDAIHLIQTLEKKHKITVDWEGAIFLGIHLKWNYERREVELSMPGYVWKSDLTPDQVKYIQQTIGEFLYYSRAIDFTALAAIGLISSNISTGQWEDINFRTNHFLDYMATHPDAKIIYKKSDMHLWTYTNASYLTEPKVRSRAGGYHEFSDKPKLPILADSPALMHNHPVLALCKKMYAVMSSIQESETGSAFINARHTIPIHQTAIEMNHQQGPTPLQFDNL